MQTPLRDYFPDDAHVTVFFFGKNLDETLVRRITRIVEEAWRLRILIGNGIKSEITGFGFFWTNKFPLPVGLVNSSDLTSFRAMLCSMFEEAEVPYDKSFGFIPHISLLPIQELDKLDSKVTTGPKTKFEFSQLHLVAGDVRVAL